MLPLVPAHRVVRRRRAYRECPDAGTLIGSTPADRLAAAAVDNVRCSQRAARILGGVHSHGAPQPQGGPAQAADVAADGARRLLALDPVLGDHQTQIAVDAFVERAAEALRAVAMTGPGHGIPDQPGRP
ncbi:MAG: hypothetical protein WCG47_07355 [Dermatophilaceae bacterium]